MRPHRWALSAGLGLLACSAADGGTSSPRPVTTWTTLTGTVVDSLLRNPIEGAIASEGDTLGSTRADGHFQLRIPSTATSFAISAPGYESAAFPLHDPFPQDQLYALRPLAPLAYCWRGATALTAVLLDLQGRKTLNTDATFVALATGDGVQVIPGTSWEWDVLSDIEWAVVVRNLPAGVNGAALTVADLEGHVSTTACL